VGDGGKAVALSDFHSTEDRACCRFLDDVYQYAEGCIRFWIVMWYEAFKQAAGRLGPPLYDGPPIPGKFNETHDEWAKENRRIRRLNNPSGGWMYR